MAVEIAYTSALRCVICGAGIEPGARKCTKCSAYQDGVECTTCGATLPRGARQCVACKAFQQGKPCRACGEIINPRLERCSICGTWQSFRRFIPGTQGTLALITSLVAVIGATVVPIANYFSNRSNTYIHVIGDYAYSPPNARFAEDSIRVLVANTGKRQSVIQSASISFDHAVHAARTDLNVMNSEQIVIKPGDPNYISFSAPAVARLGGKTKPEVLAETERPQRYATIDVAVLETDWRGKGRVAHRVGKVPTTQISQWMAKHVASN